MEALPTEIIVEILQFLDECDLLSASLTCKTVCSAARSDQIWKQKFHTYNTTFLGNLSCDEFFRSHFTKKPWLLSVFRKLIQAEYNGGMGLVSQESMCDELESPEIDFEIYQKVALGSSKNQKHFIVTGGDKAGVSSYMVKAAYNSFTEHVPADIEEVLVNVKGPEGKDVLVHLQQSDKPEELPNCSSVDGLIVLYDVNSPTSFDVVFAVQGARDFLKADAAIMVLGAKSDLKHEINDETAQEVAFDMGANVFMTVSALKNENIQESLEAALAHVMTHMPPEEQEDEEVVQSELSPDTLTWYHRFRYAYEQIWKDGTEKAMAWLKSKAVEDPCHLNVDTLSDYDLSLDFFKENEDWVASYRNAVASKSLTVPLRLMSCVSKMTIKRWVIPSFSAIEEEQRVRSPAFYLGDWQWDFLLFPQGNNTKHLSMYLSVHNMSMLPAGWSVTAAFCLTLVNFNCPSKNKSREVAHTFNEREDDWGFTMFIPLDQAKDPDMGFLVDDKMMWEVRVIYEGTYSC